MKTPEPFKLGAAVQFRRKPVYPFKDADKLTVCGLHYAPDSWRVLLMSDGLETGWVDAPELV